MVTVENCYFLRKRKRGRKERCTLQNLLGNTIKNFGDKILARRTRQVGHVCILLGLHESFNRLRKKPKCDIKQRLRTRLRNAFL